MTLRRKIVTVAFLVTMLYAITVSIAFRPAPLSVEEQKLVGDWLFAERNEVVHFGEDRSFSEGGSELGRWSLEEGVLKLRYWNKSDRLWVPAPLRYFDYMVGIEFDDSQGTAKISDPTAPVPHWEWVRQTKK